MRTCAPWHVDWSLAEPGHWSLLCVEVDHIVSRCIPSRHPLNIQSCAAVCEFQSHPMIPVNCKLSIKYLSSIQVLPVAVHCLESWSYPFRLVDFLRWIVNVLQRDRICECIRHNTLYDQSKPLYPRLRHFFSDHYHGFHLVKEVGIQSHQPSKSNAGLFLLSFNRALPLTRSFWSSRRPLLLAICLTWGRRWGWC